MKTDFLSRLVILRRGILFAVLSGMAIFMLLQMSVLAKGKYNAKDFDYTVEVEDSDEESITFRVEIENKGKDFEGYFRMSFKSASWRQYITYYDTEITLPSGGAKSFTVEIPATSVWPDDVSFVRYEVVDYAEESVELGTDSDILLSAASPRNIGGSTFLSEMEEPMEFINGDLHPLHGWSIILLVLLFVIVGGPIGYLILAKVKKRELYWILVPVLSFLFVVFIFFAGGNYRLSGLNMVSVRLLDGDGIDNDHICYMTYNAAAAPWEMEFADDIICAGGQSSDYSYGFEDAEGTLSVVNNGRSIRLLASPTETFGEYFGTAVANKTATPGCFIIKDVEMDYYGNISGTITNNTGRDLDAIFVAVEDYTFLLEGIPAGKTVEIKNLKELDRSSYGRNRIWWAEEVKYGSAFYVADLFAAEADYNSTAVYGVVEGGPRVTNGKVKESAYTVYYAVQ